MFKFYWLLLGEGVEGLNQLYEIFFFLSLSLLDRTTVDNLSSMSSGSERIKTIYSGSPTGVHQRPEIKICNCAIKQKKKKKQVNLEMLKLSSILVV